MVARRADRLQVLAAEIAGKGGGGQSSLPAICAQRMPAIIGAALVAAASRSNTSSTMRASACSAQASATRSPEQLGMIDVNVRVLTELCWLRRPGDPARGGILNVGSLAGFLPGPRMAVYYASKAYVLSFTEALRRGVCPRKAFA